MITLSIVVAVGYLVLFALCRKSAEADRTIELWAEFATEQSTVLPVPRTAPVGQALPRAG